MAEPSVVSDASPPDYRSMEIVVEKHEGTKVNINLALRIETTKPKSKSVIRYLVATECKFFVLSHNFKIINCSHFLDIRTVTSLNEHEIGLDFASFSIAFNIQDTTKVEDIIAVSYSMFQQQFPNSTVFYYKFNVLPESRKQTIFASVDLPEVDGCGGFVTTYTTMCQYMKSVPNQFLCSVYCSDLSDFNLTPFLNAATGSVKLELKPVLTSLVYNNHFTSFSLTGYLLHRDLVIPLSLVLKHNSTLTRLTLSHCGLDNFSLAPLIEAITANDASSLHFLDFSENPIEDKGFVLLAALLKKHPHCLVELNVHNCGATKSGTHQLLEALAHHVNTLTKLDISGNKITKEASVSLNTILTATGSQLNTLKMKGTSPAFEAFLDSPTITELDLGFSSLNEGERNHLIVLIEKKMKRLRNLHLSDSKLPTPLFRTINEQNALMSLESLDLSDSIMSWESFSIVCSQLSKSRTLKNFNINRSFLRPKAKYRKPVESLVTLLGSECPIECLHMAANTRAPFRQDLVTILFAVLSNPRLTSLNISGHQSGDIAAALVGKILQLHPKIAELFLDDNNITIAGMKMISTSLRQNRLVTVLPVPAMDVSKELATNPQNSQELMETAFDIQQILVRNAKLTSPAPCPSTPTRNAPPKPLTPITPGSAHRSFTTLRSTAIIPPELAAEKLFQSINPPPNPPPSDQNTTIPTPEQPIQVQIPPAPHQDPQPQVSPLPSIPLALPQLPPLQTPLPPTEVHPTTQQTPLRQAVPAAFQVPANAFQFPNMPQPQQYQVYQVYPVVPPPLQVCHLCRTNKPDSMLLPCHHVCLCKGCVQTVIDNSHGNQFVCPLDRIPVTQVRLL